MTNNLVHAVFYKLLGEPIQHYKKNVLVKEANDKYNSLCAQNGIKWDNDRANAFQHAYISAKYAYEYGADKALFIGNFVEIATWDQAQIADINKDLYNNRSGIQFAVMGMENNVSLDEIGDVIFAYIQSNSDDFIINAEENSDRYYMDDLSFGNLIKDTLTLGIKIGLDKMELSRALLFATPMTTTMAESFISAEVARQVTYSDPLLVDLDGDGIETTTLENGVYFDHSVDGFKELSAWVADDDGILVLDKNQNGIIDDGSEIFGDNYVKLDGSKATSGFDALTDFDLNNDGKITTDEFGDIRVLKGDGTLLTIEDAGIQSINLTYTNKNKKDDIGNVQKTDGMRIAA